MKWALLVAKFSDSQLRRHQWEWTGGDWLPYYRYKPVAQISDIWLEWSDGVEGFLSVRALTEGWGARWRRNDAAMKTEASRRKKVVDLITQLCGKPRWDVQLALRFLVERYEPRYKARAFCEYLQKNKGAGCEEVMAAAASYP
jgi:Transcriptional activator of glycolytic enzymes